LVQGVLSQWVKWLRLDADESAQQHKIESVMKELETWFCKNNLIINGEKK
jgi:hypothetical protein